MRARAATAMLLWLAVSWLGCGRPESSYREIRSRWIDGDPAELLASDDLRRQGPVQRFDFSDREVSAAWRGAGEATPAGLRLPGPRAEIVGDVRWQAADVREIRVRLQAAKRGRLTLGLEWGSAGEPLERRRSLRVRSDARARGTTELSFAVGSSRAWRGDLDKLRLTVESAGGVLLREIVADSSLLAAEELPRLLAQPWKVDLASDVRNAFLTAPGLAITRPVTVPEGGQLRAAFAHLDRSWVPVHYQVLLDDGSGQETLLRRVVAPEELPLAGWQEVLVDLGSWAGKDVELTLKTFTEPEVRELHGLPVWANPEVVAPQASPPRNVILISLDTLRADRMSLYGHHRETTPKISAWAGRSAVVFDNAVAQAPWTLPSHTSMLTGLSTFRHGVNHASPLPASLKLLPEYLREAGFRTLAVTGGGYVHPGYRLSQGFDRFWYWSGTDMRIDRPAGGSRISSAHHELETNLQQASDWLVEHAREPFFLFFHTYDIHHRVVPREPYFSQWSDLEAPASLRLSQTRWLDGFKKSRSYVLKEPDGEVPLPDELAALPGDIYDSRIANLDQALGGLFDQIDALGLAQNTIVVLTSDHGELLGEHGVWDHHYLYEENLRVPLIIAAPGIAPRPAVGQQVRSIDIVPTVLDLLGIEPDAEVEGRSLRELMETGHDSHRRPAWSYAARSNYGMSLRLDNRHKLTYNNSPWAGVHGEVELYRLDQDPAETAGVDEPEESERLRRLLVEKYLEEVPGIRMRFDNPGEQDLEVVVEGSITRTFSTVKSVDLDCECVEWRDRKVAVTLPPETGLTLLFENVKHQRKPIVLQVSGSGEKGRAVVAADESLDRPLVLEWTGSLWRRPPAPDGSAASVQLQWGGTVRPGEDAPEESDEKLRERLRALGYL